MGTKIWCGLNNNEAPLVSVILPTFNRAKLVSRAINSVLNQSYINLECIVIDDGSIDNTKQIVNSINDGRIIYLQHQENRHASAARNTGIKHAKGEFIAFLDDDDEWLPEKLEKQITFIGQLPRKIGMIYCWMDYYKDEKLINEHHPTIKGSVFPMVLDEQRLGGCPTLLIRKEVLANIGEFDESIRRGNDGDLIRRICNKYEVDFVPEVLVKVNVGHDYSSIGNASKESIENAIYGQKVKLIKFGSELESLPKQKSRIYSFIGYHYSELGQKIDSNNYFLKAFKSYPLNFILYRLFFRSFFNLNNVKKPQE